jgi:D-serine deaminase-like pyridoxal phosphate-dependent protein
MTPLPSPSDVRAERLAELRAEPIDWRFRTFPATSEPTLIRTVGERRWNVLGGDFLLPVLLLKESALAHNISRMADFCREHGVSLAPHGKTPMAPQLVQRQLEAGAWGVTAATVAQARLFRAFGVQRVFLANGVADPPSLAWIAAEVSADPRFDFYCLVDSVELVARMQDALERRGQCRPVQVLVELGFEGGRAGCRTVEEARRVADAVARCPALTLAGVEGYEGLFDEGGIEETLAAVDEFLARLRRLAVELATEGGFAGRGELIVSAGGSAYFDRVVEQLGGDWALDVPVRVVLRCGSYVTHDSAFYERISPFGTRLPGPPLRPALEAWGAVLSRPEPELAVVGFGKRDVPYDLELPLPQLVRGDSGEARPANGSLTVTALNDQHAFVRVEPGYRLEVGELVGCGISHPCTAFDKWPLIPVVDDDYLVIDAVRTFF